MSGACWSDERIWGNLGEWLGENQQARSRRRVIAPHFLEDEEMTTKDEDPRVEDSQYRQPFATASEPEAIRAPQQIRFVPKRACEGADPVKGRHFLLCPHAQCDAIAALDAVVPRLAFAKSKRCLSQMAAEAPVTTDATLTRDLRKSLAARKSIQTVGDFLNALMAHGVTLDTPLASIEFGIALTGNGLLDIAYEDGVIDIREGKG
jgi:hypothetical protein